jgi:PadR family transcriptional regulator, regulatory protein AphA
LSTPPLTQTSIIVLGLLDLSGPSTPYDLKVLMANSIGNFWSVPHSQLYAEPDRLLARRLVEMTQEETGRRRKVYAINDAGRAAIAGWAADPPVGMGELRAPAILALFLGADPAAVARRNLELGEAKLAAYEEMAAQFDAGNPGIPSGPRLALEAGIRHERNWVAFWRELLADQG